MDKERELLQRIDSALRHGAPGDFRDVLTRLEAEKLKGRVINMNEKKKNRFVPIAIAAALVLAILGGAVGYGIGHRGANNPAVIEPAASAAPAGGESVVTLDVNPSIELDVAADDTVAAVKALNADARVVLGSMDLAGSKLDVAVNALIGSMLTNGYLDELRNSILVSVTDGDTARAQALQNSVAGMIESALGTGGVDGAVISQTVSPDAALSELAASYNITEGKAALISKLVAADPTLTVESLAGLSVNDIALIAASRGLTDSSVTQSGTASSGAYIGADAAVEAACAHAGLDVNALSAKNVEFDSENGRMVYEIDLYTAGGEYEYDIDALTGEVVKFSRETYADPGAAVSTAPGGDYIGEEAAKAAALSHAGADSANVVWTKAQFDRDNGRYVYELEFVCSGAEYDYEIDAATGAVIKAEREQFAGGQHHGWNSQGGSLIGETAAMSAALSHAGVSEAEASRLRVELERDDGYTYYEVDFRAGWMEYEYEIDAYSGAVLKAERDYDD